MTPAPETRVRISGDGSKVFYNQEVPNQQPVIYIVNAQGGVPKNACSDCGTLLSASPDGNIVTYWPGGTPIRLFTLEVESGRKTEILPHAEAGRYRPVFSPDGRWLTFMSSVGSGRGKVVVTPFRAGAPTPERDWIMVTEELGWSANQIDWSPNGNVLYFLSDRDGSYCIWAHRLDPTTKRPVGQPFEVHHFDSARRSLKNLSVSAISLSVAQDKLVFSMGDLTGNIWMAESR